MRERNFLTIAFTLPYFFEGEEIAITEILETASADILHLRKPDSTFFQMKSLLEKIPRHLHSKIKIHDHFSLIEEFRLGGVHLNARNPIAPQNVNSLSCSMHTIEQLEAAKHYDYVTLSPIYDSISKPGYRATFRPGDLKESIRGKRVVALGGVTPRRFRELKDAGFIGAAMLGYFWNNTKNG